MVSTRVIRSTRVGYFHSRPANDRAPFVKLGSLVNADSIVCIIETLHVSYEIRSGIERPLFEIDAGLLDAAGQLVGFWFTERGAKDFIVFPFEVDSLEVFCRPLPAGSRVHAHARISSCGDRQWTATIDLLNDNGVLTARLGGWKERYFPLPEKYAAVE